LSNCHSALVPESRPSKDGFLLSQE